MNLIPKELNADHITEANILIQASPAAVWETIKHIASAWPASNHEHIQTCAISPNEVAHNGMVYFDIEKVGGYTAVMYASLYEVIPNKQFKWKAEANYRIGLFSLPIKEGGIFTLSKTDNGTMVKHMVWADFPDTLTGRFVNWLANNVLNTGQRAQQHSQIELKYFKKHAESLLVTE